MKEKEIRSFNFQDFEIESRALENGANEDKIIGYGVVFNSESRILGGWSTFTETVSDKAFEGVDLSEVIATFNHNFDNVLARADSNTLTLTIDKKGVKYEFIAPDTTVGRDLVQNIKNKNVKGSSFMFTVNEDRWTFRKEEGRHDLREILKVDKLIEIGPVVMPAYNNTTAAAKRSYDETFERQKPTIDLEKLKEELKKAKQKFKIK